MIPVSSADVRRWSKVDFDTLVGEIDITVDPPFDPLQEEIDRNAAKVQLLVGWFYDVMHLPPAPLFMANPSLWLIPVYYEPMMRQCIQLATEWEAYRNQPDQIEGVIDFDEVESFTTRGYSEVRRGHGRGVATFVALQQQPHPWPRLAKLMTDLMNPIKTQGDIPTVRAPGMPGSIAIRWDQGRYIIDAGRPGADHVHLAGAPGPYSVYDERPGGMWWVPGVADAMWPN